MNDERSPLKASRRGRHAAPRPDRRGVVAVAVGCLILGATLGAASMKALTTEDRSTTSLLTGPVDQPSSSSPAEAETSTTLPTTEAESQNRDDGPAEAEAEAEAGPPLVGVGSPADPSGRDWHGVAQALSSRIQLPSDCGLPLGEPGSLPNADRSYRGGVHEGIDFICLERGRDAVAAMDGRVVMANDHFEDPTPSDRSAVLEIARNLGYTPDWTLAMMFGRFVVIDHGVIEGAGHTVTIYAHFQQIDPSIRPGQTVRAGRRLGEIGNRGTETAATGGDRPRSIHLHWEIHVDGAFVGSGLTASETNAVYASMFDQ